MSEEFVQNQNKGVSALLNRRILRAARHSIEGLVACFQQEEAFRCEVLLSIFLLPLSFWLGGNLMESLLMVATVFAVLIAELLNTAMEATMDRFGGEIHHLAKFAKDVGSAACRMANRGDRGGNAYLHQPRNGAGRGKGRDYGLQGAIGANPEAHCSP